MKKLLILLVVISAFATSCSDDPDDLVQTGTVVVNFKGLFDGETLIFNEDESYFDGMAMRMTNLGFYASDISLVSAVGADTKLSDIEYIDFQNVSFDPNAAADGISITFTEVPVGIYTGITFGLGVKSDLNAMVPADFPSSSPLSDAGNHWTAWDSYIFMKVEGRTDIDGDGQQFEGSFLYHTGGDPLYRTVTLNQTITLTEAETTTTVIELEAKDVFTNGSLNQDIVNQSISHTTPNNQDSQDISLFITDNFVNAFTIK
ncbi:MAG: MbnP family protein [Bacteroidota bacterium]